ncbi:hypothetical protein LOC67_20750 [Stieleria sp. JC731]|uniref:hypothetical protein n=1 Tax=Pirellulaceae TaxID=2691357 RepID=UPI001E2B26E8|nr:hypothetical protein [Stieleria sp. JC731]MCC9602984.1 hypothetical protein [Stieleria sp. JC731]
MNSLLAPLDVMTFELRRSITWGRISIWVVLVAFPTAIITAMLMIAKMEMGDRYNAQEMIEPFGMAMYFLIPEVSCLLGLLLWAAPAISTEIEGQTWIYLTVRTNGRWAVLVGKYLTAVVWTLASTLTALTISCLIVGPEIANELWWTIAKLSVLSCFSHAALYILIGSVCYRRTMVAAVIYTMVVEVVASFIPAVVNEFTINYRLRGLLTNWMDWKDAQNNAGNIFGSEPSSTHIMILGVMVAIFLVAAVYRVEKTEFPTGQASS